MSRPDLELDIIENFHFDFNYREEPSLYLHKDDCMGCIVTRNGYYLICDNCSKEVTKQ